MSFDYATIAETATELLTEMGRAVTHNVTTEATYDPATGQAAPVVTPKTRQGALLSFGSGQTLIRGTLIAQNDKRLLLDPSAPVASQDTFLVGGLEYTVVSFDEINPAGTVVLYDIHLHR